MRVEFSRPEGKPERLIADAVLVFEESEGPVLAGLQLNGFTLWGGADGDVYVTVPSRAVGASTARRYFDYVRSQDGTSARLQQLKAWILAQYRAARA